MLIEDYFPPRFRVQVGIKGAADDGEDYCFPLNHGGYRDLETAEKAIEDDKAYYANHAPHDLIGGKGQRRVYRVYRALGWEAL